ncbi:MAG: hypothetical protein FJX72_15160 [Armatimonadetes bacterium]|nr:hypothetical protein [Armatimonadota bacterium]
MIAALVALIMAGPIAYVEGSDFTGGAASLFGAYHHGEGPVNFVYAAPNGARATMQATFRITAPPTRSVYLYVRGRDDDAPGQCRIAIELNGAAIHSGPSGFPSNAWATRRFAIPGGAVKAGDNSIIIRNTEASGPIGMPPWFMVARAAVAGEDYTLRRDVRRDFRIVLPKEKRPFPDRAPAGQAPGFAMRGIKGWLWKPQQYLAEIPTLARYRMNFLMNCYGSMCDIEHYPWGDPRVNRWWEPLPDTKRRAYEKVVAECRKRGIEFCFGMNPNICTKRIVRYASAEDTDLLWRHYAWMQGLGVRWFNISLDDITEGIDAAGQARLVNEILRRLRERDPDARMIFFPTYYWGDGAGKEQKPYLETLARDLHSDVYLFWTGDGVVGPITKAAAESFRRISGRRLFLWDNYPVNDANPTMHLGPVVDRDPDLREIVDGYMSNPMHSQNEINRIPLFTCADYAYDPRAYDPERSIGQAILHQTEDARGREVLRELVEHYPGMLIWGSGSTALNAVRERFTRMLAMPHGGPAAEAYIASIRSLLARMRAAFPKSYLAEKATVQADLQHMQDVYAARYLRRGERGESGGGGR